MPLSPTQTRSIISYTGGSLTWRGEGDTHIKIHKASFIANPNPIKIPLVKDNTDSPRITKYSLFSNYHITLIKYFFCFRQYRGIDFRVNTSDLTLRIRSSKLQIGNALTSNHTLAVPTGPLGGGGFQSTYCHQMLMFILFFSWGGGQHVYWEPKPSHVPWVYRKVARQRRRIASARISRRNSPNPTVIYCTSATSSIVIPLHFSKLPAAYCLQHPNTMILCNSKSRELPLNHTL